MAKCDIAFKLTVASVTSGVATGRIAERSVVRGPATSVSSWRHRFMNAARTAKCQDPSTDRTNIVLVAAA